MKIQVKIILFLLFILQYQSTIANPTKIMANNIFKPNFINSTIVNEKMGLMWKKCTEGQRGNNCKGKATLYTWIEAINYASKANFAGYLDWRIPTQTELRSLRYCSNGVGIDSSSCNTDYSTNIKNFKVPTINHNYFQHTLFDKYYWSSTNVDNYLSNSSIETVVTVDFSDGYFPTASKKDKNYIRLVRSTKKVNIPPSITSIKPKDNMLALDNGTVIDPITNIMWKRCAEGQRGNKCGGSPLVFTKNNAIIHARLSKFAGFSDWRLPTITELRILRDCNNGSQKQSSNCSFIGFQDNNKFRSPTINGDVFPNTKTKLAYISSSKPYQNEASTNNMAEKTMFFNFKNGSYFSRDKNNNGYLRLVRRLGGS